MKYRRATRSPDRAREEIQRMLRDSGAEKVFWQSDFQGGTVGLGFYFKSLPYEITISIEAYARALFSEDSFRRSKKGREEYQNGIRAQAEKSVYSILADWLKSNLALVELGFLEVEDVFLSHLSLLRGGRPTSLGAELKPRLPELAAGHLALPAKPEEE